ncbi:hypothetical protein ACFLSI_01655 [Bacteroidota bacterium]
MNKKYILLNLFVIILMCLSPKISKGQIILDDSVLHGNNFEKAAFRLWLNADTKIIRGVIVLVPGSNGDGRDMVKDTAWQNLANRHNMALLACYYKDNPGKNMAIEKYADVKKGSGQAMLDVLQIFSQKSKHAELNNAPLAFWGASAGGEFNYEFVCWKPERVIAFIVNKGGVYYSSLAPEAAREVPGVFFVGEKDSPFRNNIIKGIFSINRRFGAKWIFVEESGVAHEFSNSAKFARVFFDEIIPLRIPDIAEGLSQAMKNLPSVGYIAKIKSKQIAPEVKNKRINEITSWFPNKQLAEAWLDFIR